MGRGIFNIFPAANTRFTSTPTRLNLQTNSLVSNITVNANNTFSIADIGIHKVDIDLNMLGMSESKEFTLELYDETAGAKLSANSGTVDAIGGGDFVTLSYFLNVANPANLYSIRLYGRGPASLSALIALPYAIVRIDPVGSAGSLGPTGPTGASGVSGAPGSPGVTGATGAGSITGAAQVVWSLAVVDLTTPAVVALPLPGVPFFFNEVGVAVVAAGGAVTLQPTVQWGIVGTTNKYKSSILTTLLTAAGKRERFQTLAVDDTETTAAFEITVGGTVTAGTYTGRPYVAGFVRP